MKYHYILTYLLFLITFGGTLILNGCAASTEYNPSKMDTSLNQKITELDKNNSGEVIQFTGKTSSDINDQIRADLGETGISIETAAGDIFTAHGDVASVKKVSLLEFVVYLELVKQLDIK